MADYSMISPSRQTLSFTCGGLREADFARADRYVREALSENKRDGLILAVRARWIALAIIPVLIPFLNQSCHVSGSKSAFSGRNKSGFNKWVVVVGCICPGGAEFVPAFGDAVDRNGRICHTFCPEVRRC